MGTEVIFLGTAATIPIPCFHCTCSICQKARKYKQFQRTRSSLAIIGNEISLIDAGPDIEIQLDREKLRKIHSILITHWHADHVLGLQLLGAPANLEKWPPINLYGTADVISHFSQELSYLSKYYDLHIIKPGDTIYLDNIEFEVVKTNHTHFSVGYIIKKGITIAYLIDGGIPPQDTINKVSNADLIIIEVSLDEDLTNSNWSINHLDLENAINLWKSLGIKKCILSHLACHSINQNGQLIAEFSDLDRKNIENHNVGLRFAFDGMKLNID